MSDAAASPSRDVLFALYERMLLIRRIEESLRDENKAGNLPGYAPQAEARLIPNADAIARVTRELVV